MTLLSIFNGTVDMNQKSLEKSEMQVLLWIFNSKFEFRRAMYFTYLEALGNALQMNYKETHCRSDNIDYIHKDNWYEGIFFPKYGGTSFTYGIFTPNTRKLWSVFFYLKFYILRCFLGEQDFQSSFLIFQVIKLEIRMYFYECVSEGVSVNVFLICFK